MLYYLKYCGNQIFSFPPAYASSFVLMSTLISMLVSHASMRFFVSSSFVFPWAYAYVASENQALYSVYKKKATL